jgi:Fe-S cluster biogenesis protein NfuA/nitrite reductase/ring-hydroxylating ferredoxin subunit
MTAPSEPSAMSNSNGSAPPSPPLDDFSREGKRIQEWVEKIQQLPDSDARGMLEECLGSVLSFYGHGLERILRLLDKSGPEGEKVRDALLADPGVTGLLLIHGLHPVPLEKRLMGALDKVRPYMQSHGGDVALISLGDDRAVLRLEGHCKTCPSSTVTLELAVRAAIEEACPDLIDYEVQGVPQNGADHDGAFEHVPKAAPEWIPVHGLNHLAEGECKTINPQDEPLLICRLAGLLYAYRDRCPGCNMPLHLGTLRDGVLSCGKGHHFDAEHAGAGLDESAALHLEPVPLLDKGGEIKVALVRREAPAPAIIA